MFRVHSSNFLQTIFIDRGLPIPIGEWVTAWAPIITDDMKDGYYIFNMTDGMLCYSPQPIPKKMLKHAISIGHRPVEIRQGQRKRLVYDFGLGADGNPLRFAHHPGWHSCREPILNVVNTDGCVWAEVEIPADGYHIRRLNISGITKTREPIEWYISQRLRIVRVISDEEVQEIRQKHG